MSRTDVAPNRADQAVTPAAVYDSSVLYRMSWGAIIAGAVLALVTQFLLNMLGVGIGAASLQIGAGANNSATGFSLGAGIWWVVSGIIAAFVGGVTAGRLCGASQKDTAQWHGLVTWGVAMIAVFYLLTSAVGGVLGGAFNVVGSTVSGAGKVAASGVANAADSDAIARQAREMIDPNGAQTVQDSVAGYLKASISGDSAAASASRQRVIDGLAQSAHISPAEAQARVDQAAKTARQDWEAAKAKATEAAIVARQGVAAAAIIGFVALLLGAVAGWFGGSVGARRMQRAHSSSLH